MVIEDKGFTLIELLVVISIIGILSTVAMSSLNGARAKARDARRKTEIGEIQKALELYYYDNGYYPDSGGVATTQPNSGWNNSGDSSWGLLQIELAQYFPVLPEDPRNTSGNWAPRDGGAYNYSYYSYSLDADCSQQWYMLVYKPEVVGTFSPGVAVCDGRFMNYTGYGLGGVTVGDCKGC